MEISAAICYNVRTEQVQYPVLSALLYELSAQMLILFGRAVQTKSIDLSSCTHHFMSISTIKLEHS